MSRESADQVREAIQAGMREFRAFLDGARPQSCRLVQYIGPEHQAVDVPLSGAAAEVEGLLGEGFFRRVDPSSCGGLHQGLGVWLRGALVGVRPSRAGPAEQRAGDRLLMTETAGATAGGRARTGSRRM